MELKGNAVGIFLVGFVIILLGVTFTSVVGNSSFDATNLYTTTNETLTFTSGAATTAFKCIESISYFGNASDSSDTSAYVLGSSLNFSRLSDLATGDDITINFTKTGAIFNITYAHNCNYVDHALSRTFLNLNTLWFALFVLAAALVLVLRAYPELFNF